MIGRGGKSDSSCKLTVVMGCFLFRDLSGKPGCEGALIVGAANDQRALLLDIVMGACFVLYFGVVGGSFVNVCKLPGLLL